MNVQKYSPMKLAAALLLASQATVSFAADPVGVTASSDDGNTPENTLDNNLSTRWSAQGDGQWIRYDLGTSYTVEALEIALHKGDQRTATLDIQTSTDGSSWQTVFSGAQPSSTANLQTFDVTDTSARYVRIVGYGNSSNDWNSISEVNITTSSDDPGDPGDPGCPACEPAVVATASSDDGNGPENVLDDDLGTRWSADGSGQWLQLDLGQSQVVGSANIAFYKGDQRTSSFDIQTSDDGSAWETVLYGGVSSGNTTAQENFSLFETEARYVRYVGYGNSSNSWNSLTEMSVSEENGNTDPIGGGSSSSSSSGGSSSGGSGNCETSSTGSSVTVGCLEYGTGGTLPLANLDPSADPDENFDLSKWKITYPDASEEYPPQVSANEFYTDSATGAMVFQCPNTGGSTSNSSYSRSELREMLNESAGTTSLGNNWVISTASSSDQSAAAGVNGNMKATISVDRVSDTYDSGSEWRVGRVVVGQIHASDNEPFKVYYRKLPGHTKGWVYMAYEDSDTEIFIPLFGDSDTNEYGLTSTVEPVEDGIELGEKWGYEVNVEGREMTVTVTKADGTWARQTIFWAEEYNDDWFYFKAGSYNQNNGGDSDDYAQVSFYNFEVTHDGDSGSSSSSSGGGSSSSSSGSSSGGSSGGSSSGSGSVPSDLMENCNQWKITYPTGEEDKTLCGEANNEYFYVNDAGDGMVFYAPIRTDNGTTPNSSYIRSELREREPDGSKDVYWTTDGQHIVYVKQAITHLPMVKDHLVATQIHGNKSEGIDDAMVLRLEGDHLFLSFNGGKLRDDLTIKTGYQLGTTHEIIFEVVDGRHYAYYSEDGNLANAFLSGNADQYLVRDGSNDYVMDRSYGDAYFKIGNYTQSNADREGDLADHPDNYGEVVVYDYWIDHQ
ncbi:polysaccharide lyase family 7 protein [Microbulbifer elongatus]|uniref:Polysaccharide lyase family 7 protein n=1 Tax=Microbulbifer elongatus TaxID=86173 RepID=A0ABT1P3I2_9GAMM|nr:polysaccharide lyase family 7 protein [Microbulbifer elongatus]MCQ3830676.1 polysaccharide lyase family 7 protein [Microbulbifer elongatus]